MKGKRIVSLLLVILMAAGLLSGCRRGEQVKQGEFELFYLSADKTELVKIAGEKKDGTKAEQVQYVLDVLEKPKEESEDYQTPFQNDVTVEEFEIDGKQFNLLWK